MRVVAWNNGQHHATGAGYGLKVGKDDRDRFFDKRWTSVFISLPGRSDEVELNIARPSFWDETCRELIGQEIGRWLIHNRYAPWPSGNPPHFDLIPAYDNHFELHEIK